MGMSAEDRDRRILLETLSRIDRKVDELRQTTPAAGSPAGSGNPQSTSDDAQRELERLASRLDTLETLISRLGGHDREAATSFEATLTKLRREVSLYLLVVAGLAGVALVLMVVAIIRG